MKSTNKDRAFLFITGGRLALFILMLGAALFLPGAFSTSRTVFYMSCLLGAAFFFTVVYILWYKKKGLTSSLKNVQTVIDVLLATATVYLTGGLNSPFTFLYSIAIITACLLSPDHIGGLSAILSTLFYALVGVLTWKQAGQADEAALTFFLNMAAFNLVAVLAIYLTKRLKELEERLSVTTKDVYMLEEIQRHLANSLKSGLITVDRHGNILYYNIAAQEILGKSVENSYGKPLESIMPGCSEVLESCKEENIPEARSELSIKD
ncbi:MAG: hypothetical protein DSZ23_03045, partial [Thermodesulfatator sp.]